MSEPLAPAVSVRPPRDLGDLVARLAGEGRLHATRLDGRPIASSALAGRLVTAPVTNDSRVVTSGGIFVAILGSREDGHDHAAEAAAQGAIALLVERPIPELAVPQLVVAESRAALASAAAWWEGDPSHELVVVGITGTDGKTTTAHLLVAALEAAGERAGMVGTIATRIGGTTVAHAEHATTPEAPALQATLRAMVDAGDTVAVVETTSHGLALERVGSIAYDVAVLTNLTHEHLELHGTWEAYRDAKLRLFDRLRVCPGQARPAARAGRDRQPRRPLGGGLHRRRPRGRRAADPVRHGPGRGGPRDPRPGGPVRAASRGGRPERHGTARGPPRRAVQRP